MNEQDAAVLALGASKDLGDLRLDVHDIKELLLAKDAEMQVPADAAVEDAVEDEELTLSAFASDVSSEVASDASGAVDPAMQMAWAQTALLVGMFAVLLLQWGTQLWQCFSDKWRS